MLFSMKGLELLWLILACSMSFSFSQYCPSDEYVYCAQDHSTCNIAGSISKGYISYGRQGRFSLIPFSNTNGDTFSIRCDGDFGDIDYGNTKYCCYIEGETQIDDSQYLTFLYPFNIVQHGNSVDFGSIGSSTTIWAMKYGTSGKFVHRFISGAVGWCNAIFFNDPSYGDSKYCLYTWASLSSNEISAFSSSGTWTICANEGGYCNGLDSSAHWIRYGEGDNFYYRLVLSSDGSVPCNNQLFSDPQHGTNKFCWRSESQYSFSGAIGSWERVPSCGGCSSNEYTKTIGIEELTQSEISDSWEISLTATLSSDYKFGNVELSRTIATSVTNTLTSALTTTTTLETKYICEKNAVYQWVTDVTQSNGISYTDFTIWSEDFWCIDSGLTPQCPPGYCQDDNCQQCSY